MEKEKNTAEWLVVILLLALFVVGFYSHKKGYEKGLDSGKYNGFMKAFDGIESGELECPERCIDEDYYKGFTEGVRYIKENGFSGLDENENIIKVCGYEAFDKAGGIEVILSEDNNFDDFDNNEKKYFEECLNNFNE